MANYGNDPVRLSEFYYPPSKDQNFIWPEKPSYTNPICAILQKNNQTKFNFLLKDGQKSLLPSNLFLDQKNVPIDRVRSIAIYYLGSNLKGLVFYDA